MILSSRGIYLMTDRRTRSEKRSVMGSETKIPISEGILVNASQPHAGVRKRESQSETERRFDRHRTDLCFEGKYGAVSGRDVPETKSWNDAVLVERLECFAQNTYHLPEQSKLYRLRSLFSYFNNFNTHFLQIRGQNRSHDFFPFVFCLSEFSFKGGWRISSHQIVTTIKFISFAVR